MKAIALTYPLEIRDGELAGRVLRALAHDGQVKSDDIRVFVEDGAVTLLGTVDTPFERLQAERTVSSLHGVRRVETQLTVAVEEYLSDRELLASVEEKLTSHPKIAGLDLGAGINRGVVTVFGRVDTLEQEQSAVNAAAQVKGVREVVSAIRIGQIEPTDKLSPIVDDATLLSEVNAAIFDAGVTIFQNRSHVVHNGLAYLIGLVEDTRSIQRAEETVRRIPGIQGIRNQLSVLANPMSTSHNEALAGRIRDAFHQDGRVNPGQVIPHVTDGVVVLSGQVDSIEDHDAALQIAAGVDGVVEVVDKIRLLGRSPLRATDRQASVERRSRRAA